MAATDSIIEWISHLYQFDSFVEVMQITFLAER